MPIFTFANVSSFEFLPYPSSFLLATYPFPDMLGIKGFRGFPQFDGVASCNLSEKTMCIRLALLVRKHSWKPVLSLLSSIRESQTSHTAHHTQHIVVRRINTHRGARRHANRVVGHREEEGRVINARQVARAAGLVLLGLEREGVHVDARRGHVRVVLVRLDQVEGVALANRESVVAVELEEARDDWVLARHALNTRD